MDLTFYSEKPVNIKQLFDAGIKCDTIITKHQLYKNVYTMTWDVNDYEYYATEVLTNPSTQKAFRERNKPTGDRFVMERDFELYDSGQLVYTYCGNNDDVGICHRIFDALGIGLLSEDAYQQSTINDPATRDEMEQEEVSQSIESEYIDELWNRRHGLTEAEEIAFIDYFKNTPPYDLFSPFKLYDPSSSGPTPLLRSDMYQHEVALSVEVEYCVEEVKS